MYLSNNTYVSLSYLSRCSAQKQTCSSTLKFTYERPSLTAAPSAPRRLPTPHTWPNTPGFTLASSLTAARSAKGSSPSCHTSSNTSEPTQVTSPTGAPKSAAPRLSPSSRTCKATAAATKPINPSNATPATNASPTKRTFWNTFLNTRNQNI